MLKSYKYRIYPSDEQKEQLQCFFGVARLVYNLGLETKSNAYDSKQVNLSNYDLIKQLPELRKEYDFIKDCPSQVLQQSLFNLDKAYKNFFKSKGKFPKYKNKYSKQSIKFNQNYKILFKDNKVKLPKIDTLINVIYDREFKGIPKSVTLSKTTTNKYFISILVDNKVDLPKKKRITKRTSVGIDLGIKDLVITSDNIIYKNKNFFKSQQRRLRIEQRSLSRKQKNSKNRDKQKLKVALLCERIRNQRKYYLHSISTELVRNYNTIIIENLAVSNMVKNRKLSKAISDMGWRELRTMLEYKCNWYGKNLVVIDIFYPSSKLCSNCGTRKDNLKLSDRTYSCDSCKISIDRDLNASLNIKKQGLVTILQSLK